MYENKKVTDEDIQSLIDGELLDDLSDDLLEAILNDPESFEKFTYYVQQREHLRIWWRTNKLEH